MSISQLAKSRSLTSSTELTAAPRKIYFPNLDGLRFIAFFLVFLAHSLKGVFAPTPDDGLLLKTIKHGGVMSADIGVSFFFVLSGFLITCLILNEIQLTGKIDVVSFYIRRSLRIWPLYYLVLVWGFLVYPIIKSATGIISQLEYGNPIYYLLFLGNYDVIRIGAENGALSTNITWSVAIEEQFYLVWPLLFYGIKSKFYKHIFGIVILISALFRALHSDESIVLYFHSLAVISNMAVGGLAAYLSLNSRTFLCYFQGLGNSHILLIYLLGLILVLFRNIYSGMLVAIFWPLALSIFYAFIILEQSYSKEYIFKMSGFRLVSKLGVYTYGLYLLHPIAIHIVDVARRLVRISGEGKGIAILQAVVAFTVTLGISYLSYRFYERPFLELKQRFSYIVRG